MISIFASNKSPIILIFFAFLVTACVRNQITGTDAAKSPAGGDLPRFPGAGNFAAPAASTLSDTLASIDLRGNCTYVHGAPKTPGETTVSDSGKTVQLKAHGTEFGHHCGEDQGRFAYVALEGDFDVTVQVAHVTNNGATQSYSNRKTVAKAGIMAREGLAPEDRFVAIWAASNDAPEHYADAYHFDLRKVPGAWLGNQPDGCTQPYNCEAVCDFVYGYITRGHKYFTRDYPNVWVRLLREGDTFTAKISADGKTWRSTSKAFHQIEFAPVLYVGVALSSAAEGRTDQYAEAVFQNLTVLNSKVDTSVRVKM